MIPTAFRRGHTQLGKCGVRSAECGIPEAVKPLQTAGILPPARPVVGEPPAARFRLLTFNPPRFPVENRRRSADPSRGRALHDLNVLALIKGAERFVFVYDDDSREAVIAALRDQAADPAVTLNWFDAAVLTERARHQATRSDGQKSSRI